jgi:hypothetical protein
MISTTTLNIGIGVFPGCFHFTANEDSVKQTVCNGADRCSLDKVHRALTDLLAIVREILPADRGGCFTRTDRMGDR